MSYTFKPAAVRLLSRAELMALDVESLVEKVIGLRGDSADDAEEIASLRAQVATLTAERDAAIAARDALAGAVAAVRDARAAASAAGARYSAAWDAVDAMPPTALQSEGIAAALRVSYEAQDALGAALDALLTATPVAMVRADVVRRYVRAVENAVSAAEMMGAMRDLDAALAAAGGGR